MTFRFSIHDGDSIPSTVRLLTEYREYRECYKNRTNINTTFYKAKAGNLLVSRSLTDQTSHACKQEMLP